MTDSFNTLTYCDISKIYDVEEGKALHSEVDMNESGHAGQSFFNVERRCSDPDMNRRRRFQIALMAAGYVLADRRCG